MADKKTDEQTPKRSLRERLFDLMKFRSNAVTADMSDDDLRRALDAAIRAEEPGYLGVDSVFPGESKVVYAVAPTDSLQLFRRGFEMAEDGTVSLASDKEEVEPVTRFEPVKAAEANTEMKTACGCHERTAKGENMKPKAERIQALIKSVKNTFTTAHTAFLEGQTDDQLTALEALDESADAPKPTDPEPEKKVVTEEPTTEKVPVKNPPRTAQEYIDAAPVEIRDMLNEGIRAAAAKRDTIITAIKATGRSDYSDAELKAMSTNDLTRLAKIAAAEVTPDFSGRGTPRAAASADEGTIPPPRDINAIIRAAAGMVN